MSVITSSTFDVKKLTVSDIRKLDNGSSQVYVNYGGKMLRIQGPQMAVPYDASDYNGNQKFKVKLSFRGMDTNTKLQKFHEMLRMIDNYVIDQGTANAGKWFKMPGASRELIAAFYTPSIKISRDKDGNPKDYPPTVSVSLKKNATGAFTTQLYDDKNREMEGLTPLDVLRRSAEVVPILDGIVWVGDKKFGITWKLTQCRLVVPGEGGTQSGFMGVAEEEDGVVVGNRGVSATEEAELMSAVLPSVSAPAPVQDEESEESEEDEEVVQAPPVPKKVVSPAPAPAPAPAVKKVVKKVSAK